MAELRPEEKLEGYLLVFDSLDIENHYTRRTAFKPLYDYFQTLLCEVALRYCGQDKNCLRNQGLEARWNMLNNVQSLFDNTDIGKWECVVQKVQKIRSKVEHNDDFIPDKAALQEVREAALDFAGWLIKSGQKYYQKSKSFSYIEKYFNLSKWYIAQADWINQQYGKDLPYFASFANGKEEFENLEAFNKKLAAQNAEIQAFGQLKAADLEVLTGLIRKVERFDAKLSLLINLGICPKCGGKLQKSSTYVLGMNSTKPIALVYRVVCEKCNYVLDDQTIDLQAITQQRKSKGKRKQRTLQIYF